MDEELKAFIVAQTDKIVYSVAPFTIIMFLRYGYKVFDHIKNSTCWGKGWGVKVEMKDNVTA